MFKKDRKISFIETLFPAKRKSHKKRNTLIGLGTAAATVALAGIAVKNQDQS
jgi:hypothetical protein